MAAVSTGEVVVSGVRSLVRESGPAKAREAVVFVHGNPGSSEDWVDLLARTGDFARAVAPDMPGYGKADRPADFDYTVEGYARHLGGVLERLGIERAHLVLHDFGGPWGLAWASQHPRAVASVTLVNIGVLPGYRWHKYARIWRTPILGELFQLTATRGAFRMMLNGDNPRPFPPAFVDRMFDDMDWGTKRAILKLYRATSDLDGMSRALGDLLMPLKLPALVVWGAGDAFLPVRYAEEQRKFFDVRGVHVLEGCGHWPFIDEPARCAELIVPFLRRQVGAEGAAAGASHAG
jgi:pimeloyl-ACP methyl ester carboxylesterase